MSVGQGAGGGTATWWPYQHARVRIRHLGCPVHERREALYVVFLLRYVALVLQDLQRQSHGRRAPTPAVPHTLLQLLALPKSHNLLPC